MQQLRQHNDPKCDVLFDGLTCTEAANDLQNASANEIEYDPNACNNVIENFSDTGDKIDDSCSDSNDMYEPFSRKILYEWYVKNNITKMALSELLALLHDAHPYLPLCADTLIKEFADKINTVTDSQFHSFSLLTCVKKRLASGVQTVILGTHYSSLKSKCQKQDRELATLTFNIDGFSPQKSSSIQIWPILCKVNESVDQRPFVCGLYVGNSKPNTIGDFTKELIQECTEICSNDVVVGSKTFKIQPLILICDAPARAFCKCVKQHGGYDACDYCRQHGVYLTDFRIVTYPEIEAQLREDTAFATFSENSHQHALSPFIKLLPCVTCIPPEYMHSVLLGVMRRLLYVWVGTHKSKFRLTASQKEALSAKIVGYGKSLPVEFSRRCRSLYDVDRWKATELRTFLLYVGPVSLPEFLSKRMYQHFLLLHFAVYVLTRKDYNLYLDCAHACLQKFVIDISDIYGPNHVVYNVHLLVHLTYFSRLHGNLDCWSAFPFESYLHILKRRIRGTHNILPQLVNRISELESLYSSPPKSSFRFIFNDRDNFACVDGGVIMISSMADNSLYHGTHLIFVSDLYTYPYPSGKIHIGLYKIGVKLYHGPLFCKCVSFPGSQPHEYYIFPLSANSLQSL
jgi:hypothetical protein